MRFFAAFIVAALAAATVAGCATKPATTPTTDNTSTTLAPKTEAATASTVADPCDGIKMVRITNSDWKGVAAWKDNCWNNNFRIEECAAAENREKLNRLIEIVCAYSAWTLSDRCEETNGIGLCMLESAGLYNTATSLRVGLSRRK